MNSPLDNPLVQNPTKALPRQEPASDRPVDQGSSCGMSTPCCPICGGPLMEIRAKKHCQRCHAICETCCEGGPM